MQAEDFRSWLAGQGQITSSVATRLADARRIEAHYGDLNAAYEADRFASILATLAYSSADRAASVPNPSRLEIDGDIYDSLASYRAALNAYARFRQSAAAGTQSQADSIRRFVIETVIEPARSRGDPWVDVVSGDVHRAMGLTNAMPAVCSAIGTAKFETQARVAILDRQGPANSSTVRFRYALDVSGSADWAEVELRRRYGAPVVETQKMLGFLLADDRCVAMERGGARPQIWFEEGKDLSSISAMEVRRYGAEQPRHSNLPPRLRHAPPAGQPARAVAAAKVASPEELQRLLDWYEGTTTLDRGALERLRVIFLQKFPDFSTFEQPGGFGPVENDYKRALLARAQTIEAAADGEPEAATGAALLDLLAGRTDLDSNLLGWRMARGLSTTRAAHPGALEAAAARLIGADDIVRGVAAFVAETWPLFAEGQQASLPYGDSRTIPTMIAALLRPRDVIGIRYQPFYRAGLALLGRSLFANAPLSEPELRDTITLAQAIFDVMGDDWGWQPRDLWDVQGFIWVTCNDKAKDKPLTDAEIVARFDKNADFLAGRADWTEEEVEAFCIVARAVHEAGFDWWNVDIADTPVRFGRKSPGRRVAEGVQGYLGVRNPHLRFNDPGKAVDLGRRPVRFDRASAAAFVETLEEHADAIARWKPPSPPRPGLWPDQAGAEEDAVVDRTKGDRPMSTGATNLILFGPPGTGKTYRTAREAVRKCGEEPPHDRDALMERYRALLDEGRIEFVTFHQSMSYEEFVEGLRPTTGPAAGDDADEATRSGSTAGFRLASRDGIFKRISERARLSARPGEVRHLDRSRAIFKIALGRRGEQEDRIRDGLDHGFIHLGWGGDIDWSDERFDSLEAIKQHWRAQGHPDADGKDANIEMMYSFRVGMDRGDYVVLSDGLHSITAVGRVVGDYRFDATAGYHPHRRDVEWLWKEAPGVRRERFYPRQFRRHATYQLAPEAIDWDALDKIVYGEAATESAGAVPHVLVIDEINRANISKVFGELITLIEPDKRLGERNALKVRLPYSNDMFGVPSNLHIVGTMNTADRSIALLDTALRRRFTFVEMMPDPKLPELSEASALCRVDLGILLTKLNQRIEYLFDREHQIGHAYFLGCNGPAALDEVMRYKVIPLLSEYFHEDWSKVAAVLGDPKGERFLERETLKAPDGLDVEFDQERVRWIVRDPFLANAYAGLQ